MYVYRFGGHVVRVVAGLTSRRRWSAVVGLRHPMWQGVHARPTLLRLPVPDSTVGFVALLNVCHIPSLLIHHAHQTRLMNRQQEEHSLQTPVTSLENTCHTWTLLRWCFTTKRRYIKCMDLYLLPLHSLCHMGLRIGPCWSHSLSHTGVAHWAMPVTLPLSHGVAHWAMLER